jgi:hypothetical protein
VYVRGAFLSANALKVARDVTYDVVVCCVYEEGVVCGVYEEVTYGAILPNVGERDMPYEASDI